MPSSISRTDTATGAVETMSFTYDGSMTTGTTFAGAVNGAYGVTFGSNFWVTAERVNGDAVSFTHDNDGRLKSAGPLTIARNAQNY